MRSLHGCWTCRLRKKKCDETRPLCATCVALELNCHGYGVKPTWMDNGQLQRDEALNIKRLVRQTNSKRRMRRKSRPDSTLSEKLLESDFVPMENPSLTSSPRNSPLDEEAWGMTFVGGRAQFQTCNTDFDFMVEDSCSAFSKDMAFSTNSFFNLDKEKHMQVDDFLSSQSDSVPSDASLALGNHDDCEDQSTPTPHIPTEYNEGTLSDGRMDQGKVHENSNCMFADERSWSTFQEPALVLNTNNGIKNMSMLPTCDEQSVLRWKREDELFMHYLDEVFYKQFPFYHSSHRRPRGWLFSTLKRVRPAYHATLALSERHLQSTSGSSLLLLPSRKTNYYSLALREMEVMRESGTQSRKAGQVRSVECITCILQVLSYEVGLS